MPIEKKRYIEVDRFENIEIDVLCPTNISKATIFGKLVEIPDFKNATDLEKLQHLLEEWNIMFEINFYRNVVGRIYALSIRSDNPAIEVIFDENGKLQRNR